MATALDKDNNIIKYYLNGNEVLSATLGNTTSELVPYTQGYYATSYYKTNFGQKPFCYNPPEGFNPLCGANLQRPGVISSDQYVGVTTFIGTGDGTTNKENVYCFNFQPDLLVFKEYDGTTNWPWYDSVRGTSNAIRSNTIGGDAAFGDAVVTPQLRGFTISGDNTTGLNDTDQDIVCYAWKAGGNKGTFNIDDQVYASAAAAGLDGGDINPAGCSINTKAGFSILKYAGNQGTGQTLNHGLGEIPDFVVCKNLGTNYNWFIWHNEFGNGADAAIYFTDAAKTTGYVTQPFGTFTTSSLAFNNNDGVNGNYNYICYAWKNVPGVQKFGSYSGSGQNDGTFVYLGFRPAIVMVKSDSTNSQEWVIWNNNRSPYNEITTALDPSATSSEGTVGSTRKVDFLSNGFKLRNGSSGATDYSGRTYIYMAWADQPMHNLYGSSSNAI